MKKPISKLVVIILIIVGCCVLLFVGICLFAGAGIFAFQRAKVANQTIRGKEAGEKLRLVYAAQRAYLADNPSMTVGSLTPALLIPYLPTGASSLPTVASDTGTTLTITVNVFPPVLLDAAGRVYDPSGSRSDGLWDVGE